MNPIVMKGLFGLGSELPADGWQPFHTGIDCYPIYETAGSGPAAMLLRYEPGAHAPAHHHQGFEHILVLSGSQTDERGTHKAGTLMVQTPGTDHHVHSVDGCVVLAIWEKRVRFVD